MKVSSFLKRAAVVAASVFAVFAAGEVRADYTCYVATNGVDAEGRGGSEAPFRTLEYAVTAAKTAIEGGETAATVNVAAGTYDASAELTLDKAIGIVGADAETTIVNGAALSAARAVTMTHADARIEKLTFQDCKTKVSGGAVSMSAGTLAGCRFVTCQTKGNNTWGGALNMSSGFVTNCLFYGCSNPLADNYGKGAAVYLSGGTIIGCRFEANSTSWVLAYDGGLYVAGGTVANCVFTKHTTIPLYNDGGTVVNCLVYGNTCAVARPRTQVSHYLAGVYQKKGSLVNCTIACNTNTASAVGCAGLVAAGGTVKNTIVYDCPSADGTASSYSFTGVTASNNLLDAAPSFVDASAGNFHVKAGSLAIDTGADVSSITTADLDGVARPQLTAYDIGCYEYVSTATKLTASIVIRTPSVGPSDAATFAAFVEGPNQEGLSYAWYLDGEAYASGSDKSEISITGASVGNHTLKLVVTNSASESSTSEVANAFCVRPLTTYVSTTGGNVYPYETSANAARSLDDALAALWISSKTTGTVNIAAGTYALTKSYTLTTAVRLVGADAETTVLDGSALSAGRAVTMSHADARIEKLTLQNCKTKVSGGAVSMSAGTLADCRFVTCQTKGNNTWGGALNMSSGFVTNCLFYGCSNPLGDNWGKGAAVYLSGGTIVGSRFESNSTSWCLAYDGCLYVAGGTVENCVFTGNKNTPLFNDGGTVVNCLLYGNKCPAVRQRTSVPHYLGGVYQKSGALWNCTIACNTNSGTAVGCAGLVAVGGTVKNTIVCDCPSADGTAASYSLSGVTASNNLLDASPSFVDAATGDFHLKRGSTAIDTGADDTPAVVDLDGVVRPQLEHCDIGCYEYVSTVKELTASIVVITPVVGPNEEAQFSSSVEGPVLTGLFYTWYLDGEEYASGSDKNEISITGASVGNHTLKLVVTNSASESSTDEVADAFCVSPTTVYVSETGGNVYPYETSAKAARSLDDALAALWISPTATSTVQVAAGNYALTRAYTFDKAVRIVGADAETTVLDGTALSSTRALTLSHAGVCLENLTISNCQTTVSGGAVSMSAGTIADCWFVACKTKGNNTSGGALYKTGGVVTNCLFRGCSTSLIDNYGMGAAVYQSSGTLVGCRFEENTTPWKLSYDGAVYAAGGTVENCVFTGNTKTPLFNNGGTVVNCLFYGNRCTAVRVRTEVPHYLAGVYQKSGNLWNCTIACNTNSGTAVGCAGLVAVGGTVCNTIVCDCPAADGTTASYSFSGVTQANNLLDVSPHFRNAAKGDFRLASDSPAIDAGDWTRLGATKDAVREMRDLAGAARLSGRNVDIGCYECFRGGFTLIVR